MKICMVSITQKYYSGYEMRTNGMGGEFCIYSVEGRFIQRLVGKHECKNLSENLDVDGHIILKFILKLGWWGFD
jgi:hypothetical protein